MSGIKSKSIKETIYALRNKKKVYCRDLQTSYLNMNNTERKLLMSLVKNRRRELLLTFAETNANSLWNEISLYDKFMYLFTENEVYNISGYYNIHGDYVSGHMHQSY
jgi:hypothetical protein